MPDHTSCPGPAADSSVQCPRERPRSFGRKARLAWDFGLSRSERPSAVEAEHNQGIEEPERRAGGHKHVDCRDVGQVVAQKAPPGRGGDLGTPWHPPPKSGLAALDAEPEQF